MKDEILIVLNNIKATTGIDSAVFKEGVLLCASSGFCAARIKKIAEQVESLDSGSDKLLNISYIVGKKLRHNYITVVEGAGEANQKYASLVWQLVHSHLSNSPAALTKADKFRMLFSGELDENLLAVLKSDYSAKPVNFYVLTLVTETAAKLTELKSFLEAMSESEDVITQVEEKTLAYIKSCETVDEYQSANDFAHTLYDNIKEELRINFVINVGGTAHSFNDIKVFFRQCSFAYSFGKMLNPAEHIYSYKEYIMIKMLDDIPKNTLTQYLGTLLDKSCLEIINDTELMLTADEFLKNSLNISETSRSMYMHRNTLIYRLDKIEIATGLNLRHFNDAVIFRLITILNKLTKNK